MAERLRLQKGGGFAGRLGSTDLQGRLARKGETLVRQGRVMALDGWEALWEALWETGSLGGKGKSPRVSNKHK